MLISPQITRSKSSVFGFAMWILISKISFKNYTSQVDSHSLAWASKNQNTKIDEITPLILNKFC
jgi:hypothetical protein